MQSFIRIIRFFVAQKVLNLLIIQSVCYINIGNYTIDEDGIHGGNFQLQGWIAEPKAFKSSSNSNIYINTNGNFKLGNGSNYMQLDNKTAKITTASQIDLISENNIILKTSDHNSIGILYNGNINIEADNAVDISGSGDINISSNKSVIIKTSNGTVNLGDLAKLYPSLLWLKDYSSLSALETKLEADGFQKEAKK